MNALAKGAITLAAQSRAFGGLVGLAERAGDRRLDLLRVLTYHRVDWPGARPHLDPGLISATPKAFDQQMSYVASNYHVISAPELLEMERRGDALPPRSLLLTFDDAYCDFGEHAWPILQRYRLPATLFVPTSFPDHPARTFWWDRLYSSVTFTTRRDDLHTSLGLLPLDTAPARTRTFKRLKVHVKSLPHHEAMAWIDHLCDELGTIPSSAAVLDWDTLRQLASAGLALAAHTQTHPMMNRICEEAIRDEVVGSLRDLERESGSALPLFAYPSGGHNQAVVQALQQAGVALAFTTARGANDLKQADRLRLRRFNVGSRTTTALLRAQLLPWPAAFARRHGSACN